MSQVPLLLSPSISSEKDKLESVNRSTPESFAQVSLEARWKSSLASSIKETVQVFELEPGASSEMSEML